MSVLTSRKGGEENFIDAAFM